MNTNQDLATESLTQQTVDYFEIANLSPKHTGLPVTVWISVKGNAQHNVRVKVSPGPKAIPSHLVSVAVRPDVHLVEGKLSAGELAILRRWILLNRDVLLKYWNEEIDTVEAIAALQVI